MGCDGKWRSIRRGLGRGGVGQASRRTVLAELATRRLQLLETRRAARNRAEPYVEKLCVRQARQFIRRLHLSSASGI